MVDEMRNSPWFLIITAVFVTCLITANIIAVKLVEISGLIIPAAVVIFPISYIFGDVLTEVYGYTASRQVIWLGFFCNLLAVIAIWVGGLLPPATFWPGQAAYDSILGFTPRLLAASFIAYLFGEFTNSFVLAKLKIATQGRWLWIRTIGSTLLGEGIDSLLFITIAFMGTIPLEVLATTVATQWLFKTGYETLATPLTYTAVTWLKRVEKSDAYDRDTNFSPLVWSE